MTDIGNFHVDGFEATGGSTVIVMKCLACDGEAFVRDAHFEECTLRQMVVAAEAHVCGDGSSD